MNRAAPVPEAVRRRAGAVALLILDVDGVLTDGRLYYGDDGSEIKAFHARDGSAMKRLMAAGVGLAAISGRTSAAAARRLRELGVVHHYAGVEHKAKALDALCAATGIDAERMAHLGDDLPDLPLFDRVGMAFAVADAHPQVLASAHWVTTAGGGAGAVQEVCDLILAAKPQCPAPGSSGA